MQNISYEIATEVPKNYFQTLLDFIYVQYLYPQKKKYSNFSRKTLNDIPTLSFTVLSDKDQKPTLSVTISAKIPLKINIHQLNDEPSLKLIELTKQDIIIAIQIFEEKTRKRTLFFAWSEGEKIIPEILRKKNKSFKRLFLETQLLFFILFATVGTIVFIIISTFYPQVYWLVPFILILVQFIFVFYSGNIISRNADWTITEKNPFIHVLTYHLPLDHFSNINQIFSPKKKMQIKKDIYDKIISQKSEIDCISASKIFLNHNINCSPDNLSSKKINVYNMVKKIAYKFNFPIPKIVVSNTMIPNAATSGPSPSRGLVLITTGLLVQLEEKEIISVIGHEFGHLKGRDPLILYGLTSIEFLFRFYVLFPFFPFIASSFLFFAYFWIVMVIIFFIGKFFEARADLASSQIIGHPEILAGALEKIGFQKLLYERASSFRISEWLGLDPHPPIYFRVNRLKNLESLKSINHWLIQSIKDVIKGFLDAL